MMVYHTPSARHRLSGQFHQDTSSNWTTSGGSDTRKVPSEWSLVLVLTISLSVALTLMGYFMVNYSRANKFKWNGGHPLGEKTGTCVCGGADKYCMCTPNVAIDLVIVSGDDHLWLVLRKDTNQLATMGGFAMVGESLEETVLRELKEETGIEYKKQPVLFGAYSDPRRDNRRHTVSVVYAIHLDGHEHPVASDDVKEVKRIPMSDIEKYEYFADHKTILLDYRRWHHGERKKEGPDSSVGDFAPDIRRSTCHTSGPLHK